MVEFGAELGVEEFVIGMAHRGRLNVLANILGKTYNDIFAEFEGKGFGEDVLVETLSTIWVIQAIKKLGTEIVHLSLTPNPSHRSCKSCCGGNTSKD